LVGLLIMNTISLKIVGILLLIVVVILRLNSINNSNQTVEVKHPVLTYKTEKKAIEPRLKPSRQTLMDNQIAQANQIPPIINNNVVGENSLDFQSSSPIKNNVSNSLSFEKDQLNSALSSIPINYHSMFHWQEGHDQELVDAYISVTQLSELDERQKDNKEFNGVNLEELISDLIYQHELVEQIQIESLSCNNVSCVMYGVEWQSGVWSMITEEIKGQQWAEFSQETTRSAVDENGNLTFLTIIKR
jgi:hypothetical protein